VSRFVSSPSIDVLVKPNPEDTIHSEANPSQRNVCHVMIIMRVNMEGKNVMDRVRVDERSRQVLLHSFLQRMFSRRSLGVRNLEIPFTKSREIYQLQ